jgi:hypothetical protein
MNGKLAIALLLPFAATAAQPTGHRTAPLAWPAVTRDAKPWTRWWWLGSAVDSTSLTAQLEELSTAGFGGVEITPIYGVRGADSAEVPYLSRRWVALLAHAASEAHRLGMAVDMPPGSGWRMGGPFVPPSDANTSLRVKVDTIPSGEVRHVAELRFSGDRVKRPAPGGEGVAIDVFSRGATERFLRAFGERLAPIRRGALRSFFHDSFEYTGDATPQLFERFRQRRGYDLARQLPALSGRGDPDTIARVKSDYRRTLDELLLEDFVAPLLAWSHAQGSLLREQAHGSPGNLLDLYAASDIPETESFGPLSGADADPLVNRFASSAAHLAGRRLASAESFTWLGEHFSSTLDDVKRAADLLFLAGVNHLIYHGTAYSPPHAAWPGWQFYASMEFNPRNTIWRDLPAFNAYVGRVQAMLQSGRVDNDVLLYWPIWDNWHDTAGRRMDFRVHNPTWLRDKPVGAVATMLERAGYGFDYVLSERLSVTAGRLCAGDAAYATLVIPPTEHMPPETLERLIALARDGATVIFVDHLPADVPGLAELGARRARLTATARSIVLGPADASGVRRSAIGSGRILVGAHLDVLLAAAGIRREPAVDRTGLRLLRQSTTGGRQYFVSYTGEAEIDEWIPLAVEAASVAIMDPMTGRVGLATIRPGRAGGTDVRLGLAPGQSLVLRTFDTVVPGKPWRPMWKAAMPQVLGGNWSVDFIDGDPVRPASFRSDSLATWTGRGDDDADRFAGTARYSLRFDAPPGARNAVLDLGRVAESARVRLNGRVLGTLVARPFRMETGAVRRRDNVLEVEVTNLAANRIRDLDRRGVPWKVFKDINYVSIDYKPFDASGWPVRPSGLIGPVTLTVTEPVRR